MRWRFMPVKHHENDNSARCLRALFRSGESEPVVMQACRRAEANSAASPSSSAADRGASEFPVADAPHSFFSEWLNCFLPLVMGTHEDNWPGSVHRAHSPALSHNTQGACVS